MNSWKEELNLNTVLVKLKKKVKTINFHAISCWKMNEYCSLVDDNHGDWFTRIILRII